MGTGEEPLERVGIRESWKQNPMVEGTLKKLRKIAGQREWNHCRKGGGKQEYKVLEVGGSNPLTPLNLCWVGPDRSHCIITFQLTNQF